MRYEKQSFTNETVTLDGNEFIDCNFSKCTFEYGGGDFNIERIRFDTLGFTVSGPAMRTVLLLRSLWANEAGRKAVLSLLDPDSSATRPQ